MNIIDKAKWLQKNKKEQCWSMKLEWAGFFVMQMILLSFKILLNIILQDRSCMWLSK